MLHILQLCLYQLLCSRKGEMSRAGHHRADQGLPILHASPSLSNCSLLLSRAPISWANCSGLWWDRKETYLHLLPSLHTPQRSLHGSSLYLACLAS